jgi:uncharacterized protein (DUF2147 family)
MKGDAVSKATTGLAMALLLSSVSAASADTSAVGTWLLGGGGEVRIENCGAALCGILLTSKEIQQNPTLTDTVNDDPVLRQRRLKGMQILSGFAGKGPAWSGGSIYNPSDGKTYAASLELVDPETLKVQGCVLYIFCKTQTWHRAH